MVGITLLKFAKDVKGRNEIIPMAVTIVVSVLTKNMAIDFGAGIISFYLLKRIK